MGFEALNRAAGAIEGFIIRHSSYTNFDEARAAAKKLSKHTGQPYGVFYAPQDDYNNEPTTTKPIPMQVRPKDPRTPSLRPPLDEIIDNTG